jgi:hypothetical protein
MRKFFLCLLGIVLFPLVYANDIFIPGNYSNIQYALTFANSGDNIIATNITNPVSGNLKVPANITLTLSHVILNFSDGSRMTIEGTLNAKYAIFTSFQEYPHKGDWDKISFAQTSIDSLLDNTVIEYAGGGYGTPCSSDMAGIKVDRTSVNITNSIIRYNQFGGIHLINSSSIIDNTSVLYTDYCIASGDYGGYGLSIDNGNPVVTNSLFQDNPIAIYLQNEASPIIEDSIFEQNENPIWVYNGYPYLSGNDARNNTINGVYVTGNVNRNITWNADLDYVVSGQIVVFENKTLTLEPGAIIKFYDKYSGLSIGGTLKAMGTNDNKIIFTSFKDDEHGVDSNNDNYLSSPKLGDWDKIYLAGKDSEFDNVVLNYAGGGFGTPCSPDMAGIRLEQTSINISNSIIGNSQYTGINSYNSTLYVSNVSFINTKPCVATYSYGGTALTVSEGNLLVKNSKFIDNRRAININSQGYFYLNDFNNNSDNGTSSVVQMFSPERIVYSYNGHIYNNFMGNYWGACTYGIDGICDNAKAIGSVNDSYALAAPYEDYLNLTELACADGIKNSLETDIDCGGYCARCTDGKSCIIDSDCKSGYCSGICLSAARPVIVTPLTITTKESYYVGDNIQAQFMISNKGTIPIAFDALTVGGRLNGWCPGACPDFPFEMVTLDPEESFEYHANLTLYQPGNYHFFIAYFIENPSDSEARLLDKNNWNTMIALDNGLTQEDRVKSMVVLSPENLSAVEDSINNRLHEQVSYPPYLQDPDSFTNAVASLWNGFASWITQVDLVEKYDNFYQMGMDFDALRFKSLKSAQTFYGKGNITMAVKYLNDSYRFERLSQMGFDAAQEIYDGNLEAGETIAEGIKSGCQESWGFYLSITNPSMAKTVSYLFVGVDYIIDLELVGKEEAMKNLLKEIIVKALFDEIRFDALDGRTISDYTANKIGKLTFPALQETFKSQELQSQLIRIIRQSGLEIEEDFLLEVVNEITNELGNGINWLAVQARCPVEIIAVNGQATTGILNGSVMHEISESYYANRTITAFFANESVSYEIHALGNGTYDLIASFPGYSEGMVNVSIQNGTFHSYIFNNQSKIILGIDEDGDGYFQQNTTLTTPVINISYWPESPIINQTILFNASASYDLDGEIMLFEWQFGDGNTSTGAVVYHAYRNPGLYEIILNARGNSGAFKSRTQYIYVYSVFNLSLNRGWNLVSIPLSLEDTSTPSLFNTSIYDFQNNTWSVPKELESSKGYWVFMNESINLSMIGKNPVKLIDSNSKWSLLGPLYRSSPNQSEWENYSILSYENQQWKSYVPNRSFNSLQTLKPGHGYWVWS